MDGNSVSLSSKSLAIKAITKEESFVSEDGEENPYYNQVPWRD